MNRSAAGPGNPWSPDPRSPLGHLRQYLKKSDLPGFLFAYRLVRRHRNFLEVYEAGLGELAKYSHEVAEEVKEGAQQALNELLHLEWERERAADFLEEPVVPPPRVTPPSFATMPLHELLTMIELGANTWWTLPESMLVRADREAGTRVREIVLLGKLRYLNELGTLYRLAYLDDVLRFRAMARGTHIVPPPTMRPLSRRLTEGAYFLLPAAFLNPSTHLLLSDPDRGYLLPSTFATGKGPTREFDLALFSTVWSPTIEAEIAGSLPAGSPLLLPMAAPMGTETPSDLGSLDRAERQLTASPAQAPSRGDLRPEEGGGRFDDVRAALVARDRRGALRLIGDLLNHPDCTPIVASVREEVAAAWGEYQAAIGRMPEGEEPKDVAFRIGPHALLLVQDLWEYIRRGSVVPRDGFSLLAPDRRRYAARFLETLLPGTAIGQVAPQLILVLPPFDLDDEATGGDTARYLELFRWCMVLAEREIRRRVPLNSEILGGPVLTAAGEGTGADVEKNLATPPGKEGLRSEGEADRPDPEPGRPSSGPDIDEGAGSVASVESTPAWASQANYIGRTYLALEKFYRDCPDEFVSVARIDAWTKDRSAKQGVQALKKYPELRVLIESVRDAQRADKPVPKDAQGYRLTGLPGSRKGREGR